MRVRFGSGQFRQDLVSAFQRVAVERLTMLGEIVVGPRVVPLFVAVIRGPHHQAWSSLRPLADSEERRVRAAAAQDRQHPRRPLRGGTIVDSERDQMGGRRGAEGHRGRIHSRPCWPHSLRAWPGGREGLFGRHPGTGPSYANRSEQAGPG